MQQLFFIGFVLGELIDAKFSVFFIKYLVCLLIHFISPFLLVSFSNYFVIFLW